MKLIPFFLLFSAAALHAQDGMLDRYLAAAAQQCWNERAAAIARIRTPAQAAERQQYIRSKVLAEIGGFPGKTPLNPRVTGTLVREGYRVEKLIYESQPNYYVTANVYVPAGRPPYAAVLGTAGHSAGGKAFELYQRAWISLAKRGFLVLAYDPPGQGERSEYWDAAQNRSSVGGGTAEHTMAGIQCLLTGTNVARYELWDGIRAVDYLLTRKDVDPARIAAIGNSGGGTQSAYLAVVEPRLAAAVPSCYITSWQKLWFILGPQDAEQNFAGFLRDGLEFPDFLIAFAPRPIQMLTAVRDFFPIDGARATYTEARRIFEVLGKPERIGYFEYDDPHGWSKPRREATYRWLEKWLHNREDDGAEPEFQTEPEAALNCTPTGQVATSLKGETIQSMNAAFAERLAAQRKTPARALVAARLALPERRGAPKWSETAGGVAIETERGIVVPAKVFAPEGEGRKPALICLDADCAPRADRLVLVPEPRGWRKAAPQGKSGYSREWQTAMRAILVGQTIVGMQVYDLLRCFDYLASRPDVDPARIEIAGKGIAGVLALYASALEPRISQVHAEPIVSSYMEIVRARKHEGILPIVVPGVLRDFDLPDLVRIK